MCGWSTADHIKPNDYYEFSNRVPAGQKWKDKRKFKAHVSDEEREKLLEEYYEKDDKN